MIIDGRLLAEKIRKRLAVQVATFSRPLQLAAVLVGDDPQLKKFVQLKKNAAEQAGITFSSYELPDESSEKDALEVIKYLNADDDVDGIFVELPMPKGIDRQVILDAVAPNKDVDVLSSASQKLFFEAGIGLLPPAVGALKYIVEEYKLSLKDMSVAVFGDGFLVGKPVRAWLARQGALVTSIDEYTKDAKKLAQSAKMIISAVGKKDLITEDMVSTGVIVIDYGFNKKGSEFAGDVDFEDVAPKASLITPVPGGMGPLVITAVLENLIQLAE